MDLEHLQSPVSFTNGKGRLTWKPEVGKSLWTTADAEIHFAFRTLRPTPSVLLFVELLPLGGNGKKPLFLQVKLENAYEMTFRFPHSGNMTKVRLRSQRKLCSGDWNSVQILANDRQMRVSVSSVFLVTDFDSVHYLNESTQAIHLGGLSFL